MSPADKTLRIKRLALEIGFDQVGVARLGPTPNAPYYRQWLAAGHAGAMAYLGRNRHLRENPAEILPGARSAVCVSLNYRRSEDPPPEGASETAGPTGRVAQYARGADYHLVMREMLHTLLERMRREWLEDFEARVFVDTGPLIERELAASSGLGWIGKNTLLIHPRTGSFTFLGEILCTLDLAPDAPMTDHCGTCRRCLDACPTQAFIAPYQMDASRCISYLTIEHKDEIPAEFHAAIGDHVYGCDICQDVCPHNAKAPLATYPQLTQRRIPTRMPLRALRTMRAGAYRRLTRGTAARRASAAMWRRNAEIAMNNIERAATAKSGARTEP